MNPRISPEIMQALMRRRAGGLSGGQGMPAQSQVMTPNPLGGQVGPSLTPLQTSPMAVPSGSIPQSMPSSGGAPGQPGMAPSMNPQQTTSAGQTPASTGNDPNKVLMKALLQRLIADS